MSFFSAVIFRRRLVFAPSEQRRSTAVVSRRSTTLSGDVDEGKKRHRHSGTNVIRLFLSVIYQFL